MGGDVLVCSPRRWPRDRRPVLGRLLWHGRRSHPLRENGAMTATRGLAAGAALALLAAGCGGATGLQLDGSGSSGAGGRPGSGAGGGPGSGAGGGPSGDALVGTWVAPATFGNGVMANET